MKKTYCSLLFLFLNLEAMATIVPRLETESEFSRKKHILKSRIEKNKERSEKGLEEEKDLGLGMPNLLYLKQNENTPYAHSLVLSLDNDNQLLLDRFKGDITGDDFGQTHAMYFKFLRYDKRDGSQWGIEFETGLYTRFLGIYRDDNNILRARQEFREISTLSLNKKWPTDTYSYIKNRLEVGLQNDREPVKGLALWQQAGSDGNGGFHDFIGLSTKNDNIGTGAKKLFLGAEIGYGRLFPLAWENDFLFNWNEIDVTVEASALFRTIWAGTQGSVLARANIPLMRVTSWSKSNKFLSFNIQGRFLYFPEDNATGTTTTLGLQFQFTTFGLAWSISMPDGNQNQSFTKYADSNQITSLTLFGEL